MFQGCFGFNMRMFLFNTTADLGNVMSDIILHLQPIKVLVSKLDYMVTA